MNAPTSRMRRIYADLVKRRASVRIVPAVDLRLGTSPIFVVGLYRSGTTPLRYVLDSHSRIACPPESEFLAPLAEVMADQRTIDGLQSLGFDRPHVVARIREFALYFFDNYAQSAGKVRWADKTPRYVDHLSFIDEVFPNARYVVIHRHPLDQVHSHTRGGATIHPQIKPYVLDGEDVRISAARYWADKTARILQFVADDQRHTLQIKYESLCDRTEETLRSVFSFIEEPWESQTLDYHRFPHDVGFEGAKALGIRGFEKSSGAYKMWPPSIRETSWEVVQAVAREVGYDCYGEGVV